MISNLYKQKHYNIRYKIALVLFFGLLQNVFTFAGGDKEPTLENTLLWEVSGKGLAKPSYLFGTFHLRTSTFIDSFPIIGRKFNECEAVAGEVVIDSSSLITAAMAGMMKDTTLTQLLSKKDFNLVSKRLKKLSGYDLILFNNFCPVMVELLIEQSYYKDNSNGAEKGQVMDMYFQQQAKEKKKKLLGLESIDDQVNIIYHSTSYKMQAQSLVNMVKHREKKSEADMSQLVKCYNNADLTCLNNMLHESGMSQKDEDVIVKKRNDKWIAELPEIMQANSVFVAVGALHLTGQWGLIAQLRSLGYTVKPVMLH